MLENINCFSWILSDFFDSISLKLTLIVVLIEKFTNISNYIYVIVHRCIQLYITYVNEIRWEKLSMRLFFTPIHPSIHPFLFRNREEF
jgi:hypothetical protein